jgi:hypothetical protein
MQINLQNVRISYPHLFKTEEYKGVDTGKYAAKFLLDETEHADAITEIKKAGLAFKKQYGIKKFLKMCLKTGEEVGEDGYEYAINAKTKRRPLVTDKDNSILTAEDDKIYAGCYVDAVIHLYASSKYDTFSAFLVAVRFRKDGEALGGSGPITPAIFDVFDATDANVSKIEEDDEDLF